MKATVTGLLLALTFAAPVARADEATDRAIAHVKKLGGFVKRDENRPDKPVVAVAITFKKTVKDDDLKDLAPLTELTSLNLESTSVTAAGLKHLTPLKNLTTLNLNYTNLTASGLKSLAALPKLTSLSIYSCDHNDNSLKELAAVKSLTSLVVSGTVFDLTDAVMKEWGALKNLRTLHLHGPNITDEGLKHIAAHTELTELQIWFPAKTTATGWKPLGRLTKLKSLSLAGGNVPKPAGGNITDTVLKDLAPLANLEKLELNETGVADPGLATIAKFGKLTSLRIASSATVTDAGVKHLTGLKNLTTLDLTGSSITDDGAKVLAGFQKLTVLEVGRTGITREGAKSLRAAIPGCKVTWYPKR